MVYKIRSNFSSEMTNEQYRTLSRGDIDWYLDQYTVKLHMYSE